MDEKVQEEMSLLAKRAVAIRVDAGGCDRVCGANGETQDVDIIRTITSIESTAVVSVVCNSDSNAYAVSSDLVLGTNWCIDDSGVLEEIALPLGPGVLTCS